jgi:cystathionine beta-lyase
MKFNTKVYTVANIQTQAQAVMPPIYQTTTYAQTSPGHPMGNMNTVELQTPHEQL